MRIFTYILLYIRIKYCNEQTQIEIVPNYNERKCIKLYRNFIKLYREPTYFSHILCIYQNIVVINMIVLKYIQNITKLFNAISINYMIISKRIDLLYNNKYKMILQ